jgi:erythromycin esterase-like protein
MERALAPLASDDALQAYPRRSDADKERTGKALVDLMARFDRAHDAFVAASSRDEWVLARQAARVLQQAETKLARGNDGLWRDQSMSENLDWLLANAATGTRVVFWGHDGHVDVHPEDDFVSLGTLQRRTRGRDYVALGTLFDLGEFRAIDMSPERPGLRGFSVPSLTAGLGATLAAIGQPRYLLDLHTAPPGPVTAWLAQPHPVWLAGSVFRDGDEPSAVTPSASFDGLVFVARTTPTHRLKPPTPSKLPGAPDNLDFERGAVGKVPPGWWISPVQDHQWGFRGADRRSPLPGPDGGRDPGSGRVLFDDASVTALPPIDPRDAAVDAGEATGVAGSHRKTKK